MLVEVLYLVLHLQLQVRVRLVKRLNQFIVKLVLLVLPERLVKHQPEQLGAEYVRVLKLCGLIQLGELVVGFDIGDHEEL